MLNSTVTQEGSNTRDNVDSSPAPGAPKACMQVDPTFDFGGINRLAHILAEIARKTPFNTEPTLASTLDDKSE